MTLSLELRDADGAAAFVTMTETDLAADCLEADVRDALANIDGIEVCDR